jgi:hypothetical protein
MLVPDPNFFGGEPMVTERDGDWMPLDISVHPFGKPNPAVWTFREGEIWEISKILTIRIFFRWPQKACACNDLRKWSHYTFRVVS